MKTKKLIAALLALVMLLSELPGLGCLTALAAGSGVYYSRLNPEVAIMNAYTGNDSGFYTKVQNDAHYNFAEKISGLGYSKTISDDKSVSYEGFGGTVLSRLSNQFYNPMEASYSATFNNKNGHSHALGLIKIDTSYISSIMYINGGTTATPSGLGGISSTTTRQGNGKFKNYYPRSDGRLLIQYQNSKRIYTVLTGKEYECNCGGDVYNHTIFFRDQTAPFIIKTDIMNASDVNTSEFTAGEKIRIKLTCSEPLRFAGDAVPSKDICIGLQTDGGGKEDQLIAKLTSLQTKEGSEYYSATNISEMIFEYTVPDTKGNVITITGLDFAPTNINTSTQAALYDKNGGIGLVQVCGSGSFSLTGYDKIGYTRTTSYITDLAGNALEDTSASCRFYIDSEQPYVAQISASAITNNANVKEKLGKTEMDPTADPLYPDASDSNLSAGDSITFNVYLNEIITPNIAFPTGHPYYANATLTTNLLDKNGQPVTVTSEYAQSVEKPRSELGKGSSNGRVTMLGFRPITIAEGMTIAGGNTISVKSISFSGDPADNAGNICVGGNNTLAAAQNYQLDMTPPTAVLTSDVQKKTDGSYVLGFTVSDSGSGVASLDGSFRWVQDNCTASYEYALTGSTDSPAEWKTATMSSSIPFTQTGAVQYLHLRSVSNQEYDIHSSSLLFTLSDYAGNCGTMEVSLGNNVIFDTVPPVITRGTESREYDNDTQIGTLTVTVNIADSGRTINNLADGDEPMYLFAAPGTEVTAESSGWQKLTGLIDGTNTAFTTTAEVSNGEKFEQDLYVKVGDSFGNNTGAVRVGTYTYNLEAVGYTLDYSTAVATTANLKVPELDSDGFLFVYFPTGRDSEFGEYYGRYLTGATSSNIFTSRSSWGRYNRGENDGSLIFTRTAQMTANDSWLYDPANHEFTGIIDFTVISGKQSSVTNTGDVLTISGSENPYSTEQHELLVVKERNNSYTPIGSYEYVDVLDDLLDVRLTNPSEAALVSYTDWSLGQPYVMESLAGLPINVSITPKTGYDWVLDDIDLNNSLILVYKGTGNASFYKHIGEITLGSSFTQTINLPEMDYGKGEIHLRLLLKRKANCNYYSYYSNDNCFLELFVDNTQASDDFALMNVIHTYDVDGYSPAEVYANDAFGMTLDEVCTDLPVDKSPYMAEGGNTSAVMTVPYYYYNGSAEGYNDWNSAVYLTFSSNESNPEITDFGEYSYYTGLSVMQAWNITSGSGKVQLDKWQLTDKNDVTKGFKKNRIERDGRLQLMIADSADSANALASTGKLGVVKNSVNIIAVQTVYQNRKTSGVKYYAIYPKEESDYPTITPYVDGVDVSERTGALGREVSYTVAFPAQNEWSMYVKQTGGTREELKQQGPGAFSYVEDPMKGTSCFFMTDSYGIAIPLWSPSRYRADRIAPNIRSFSPLEVNDGAFTASFTIWDNTFMEDIYNDSYAPTIHLGFNEEYSNLLGVIPGDALDIDLSQYTTEPGSYLWKTDGTDGTGIAQVYAKVNDNYSITVEVRGFISPEVKEPEPQDVTLEIAVSDVFDNRMEPFSVTANDVFGVEPKCILADFGPQYAVKDYDMALCLDFTAPVQPAESWIDRNISGFEYTWCDAFPITNDGDWDITYTDIFGSVYTRTVTIPDGTFGEEGFDLTISTLNPTAEDVTISAATDDGSDCFVIGTMNQNGRISLSGTAETSKTYTAAQDGCYVVVRLDSAKAGQSIANENEIDDYTFIHLNNVAKVAPEAKLNFYFEEYGDSFTAEELLNEFPGGVTTTNFVRVSYTTARHVTARGETEHIFTNDGNASCTFSYTDDFGHNGSATVTLADYGITLAAPPEPYKDTEQPSVSVDIYAKRGNAYLQTEFFSPTGSNDEAVSDAFERASYVQDYSLVLNVTDYSAYRILLLTSEPDTLSYDSQSTFSNETVTLSGNTIHISKEFRTDGADFWVAVVDNAKDGTKAPADNFTAFKITQSELAKWFDNVQPEIGEKKEYAESLYQHTLYLKLYDTADSGALTDGLTVSGNALRKNEGDNPNFSAAEYPYCITFNTNISVPVTVTDVAGNFIFGELKPLTEIDDSAPVLTVEWSPALVTESGIDSAQPTNGPVNTEVTAHIYSDKPIDLTGTMLYYTEDGNYYELPQDGTHCRISWDETSQRITVTFAKEISCGEMIKATVYAPNGQNDEVYLQLASGTIDVTEPVCDADKTPLMRSAASAKPYAIRYTLEFSEDVFVNGGSTLYGRNKPYSFVLYGKDKQNVTVTDLAGNVSVLPFDTETDIPGTVPDNTAPVITFIDPEDGDFSKVSASGSSVTAKLKSDEDCTLSYDGESIGLTANTEKTVTFASNGTRTLRFVDDAGNETKYTVTVSAIDNIAPVISMTSSTVKITQDCTPDELKTLLDAGVTATDNNKKTDPTLTYDSSSVNLNLPGTYTVVYTATDAAGNIATAKRFVKVISKDLPKVCIDGEQLESSGVISIAPGEHTLTVSNLREAGEPYKIVIARGIYYDGQIKYLDNQITVGSDGKFTISTEGFYTFYLQTQSRQSLRCLIDVEG